MLSIYLSSPVSSYQRDWNNKVGVILRSSGIEVKLPQEITPSSKHHKLFPQYIYQKCIDMIQESDFGLLLLPYGKDCAWEAGYYRGLNKPMIVYVSQLSNGGFNFLRDWMVKGGLNEIVVDSLESYSLLKKDPILKNKPITKIDSINELPSTVTKLKVKYSPIEKTFLGVGAVVIKNNKVLLVREKEDSDIYYKKKGMWGYPTKILKNKDPKDQSLISLEEEVGIQGKNPEFLSMQNIPNAVGLFYRAEIDNESNIKNGRWFDIEDVMQEKIWMRPTYSNVLKFL